MIHSMTGYGSAEYADDRVILAAEIRSVNHRFLKLSIRLPEAMLFAEPVVDGMLRDRIRRGAVTYSLRCRATQGLAESCVNLEVLQAYVNQLARAKVPGHLHATVDLAALTSLPGVCSPPEEGSGERDALIALIRELTLRAVDAMNRMRRQEGEALRNDLRTSCAAIRTELVRVAERAPLVIRDYHEKLRARVASLVQTSGLTLEAENLAREVALFAERSDISEELARLGSHLNQFDELCHRGEPVGRTLDFLTQELLREANTIASKSNDAAVAMSMVEIKGWIDRLREQVQNVE